MKERFRERILVIWNNRAFWLALAFALLAFSACSPAESIIQPPPTTTPITIPIEPQVIVTNIPTNTPVQITATSEILPTATPSPTLTNTAMPTPTLVPSATPITFSSNGAVAVLEETIYLRETPSDQSFILRILNTYAPVQITARTADNQWLNIMLSDTTAGWVHVTHIDTEIDLATIGTLDVEIVVAPPTEVLPPTNTPVDKEIGLTVPPPVTQIPEGQGVVNTPALRIRKSPGLGASVLTTLYETATVTIIGRTENSEWLQIIIENGDEAWAYADYLDTEIAIADLPVINIAIDNAVVVQEPPPATNNEEVQAPAEVVSAPASTNSYGNATIIPEGEGLRMRANPGLGEDVITNLSLSTTLEVVGRSNDSKWVQVRATGSVGWVSRAYLNIPFAVDSVPVTGETIVYEPPPDAPQTNSIVSGVTSRSVQIFQAGQQQGNRANVFSKIGDSLTVATFVMYPIGWGQYQLGGYQGLQSAINYFSSVNAREGNSFANVSLAADNGWTTRDILDPGRARGGVCQGGETPIECELRVVKPSVAIILIGTNDISAMGVGEFQGNLQRIVDISIQRGVIPVLTTIPVRAGFDVSGFNGAIIQTARANDIPLIDYFSALLNLPNNGLSDDGVHPSFPSMDFAQSAIFSAENLQYGYVIRNVTVLQALDAIWRQVIAVAGG